MLYIIGTNRILEYYNSVLYCMNEAVFSRLVNYLNAIMYVTVYNCS